LGLKFSGVHLLVGISFVQWYPDLLQSSPNNQLSQKKTEGCGVEGLETAESLALTLQGTNTERFFQLRNTKLMR